MGCAAFAILDNTYQEWTGLPSSPVLSGDYPYQIISYRGSYYEIGCFITQISIYRVDDEFNATFNIGSADLSGGVIYRLLDGEWIYHEESNYVFSVTAPIESASST
jgi:hypothetical protein